MVIHRGQLRLPQASTARTRESQRDRSLKSAHLDDNPARYDARAGDDRATVACRLTQHRCGLAGNRGLVDHRNTVDDRTVARDQATGLHDHHLAADKLRGRLGPPIEQGGSRVIPCGADHIILGAAASSSKQFGDAPGHKPRVSA